MEYENNLLEVLTRLSDARLTLKEVKCEFGMTEVQYLGYQVLSCGLEWLAERIQPVMNAPAPTCEKIEVSPRNAQILQPVPAEHEYGVGATS